MLGENVFRRSVNFPIEEVAIKAKLSDIDALWLIIINFSGSITRLIWCLSLACLSAAAAIWCGDETRKNEK